MSLKYNSEEHVKYVNESARTIELDFFVGRHLFDLLENIRTKEGKYPGDKDYHEWINAFETVVKYAWHSSWDRIRELQKEAENEREGQ